MTNGTASETNGITSEAALLPCPFCGGKVKMRVSDDNSYVIECGNHDWPSISVKRENTTIAADILMCSWGDGEDAKQTLIEAWNARVAVTDHDCGECKERQGYYLDAETIRNQQERIAELTIERDTYFEMVKRVQADCDARDELIRDMWEDLVGLQGGYEELGYQTSLPEFAERLREFGIEVD